MSKKTNANLISLYPGNIIFIPADTGQSVIAADIDNIDDIPMDGYCSLKLLNCFRFIDSGIPNTTNIKNDCDSFKEATVRWVGRGGYQEDVIYRLVGGTGRLIRTRGTGGAIISERDVDFSHGQDATNHVNFVTQNIQGGVLWSLRNRTNNYVVFKVSIYKENQRYGETMGILDPNSRTRIFWFFPHENGWCWVDTARFEPN